MLDKVSQGRARQFWYVRTMFVTSLDHDNLILKSYYKYHRASSYRCHRLGVFLSNVPEDRKVFPKQRTCLKDHLPRFEHFASTQLCNCEAQKLSWKIWPWLLQDAFGSLIILALQSRQLGWIFSFDEFFHLRCALANTKFSKPNDFCLLDPPNQPILIISVP